MSGARINYSGFNISQTDTCEHLSCGFECGLSDLALLFGGRIFMHVAMCENLDSSDT